jgi:phosphoribosylamine--glycine ligase
MKVLVIGSGGREHSLVWMLDQSPRVSKIYCAPGNAGISKLAECVAISATDVKGLVSFAKKQKIDLTLVGPESSLTLGVVDAFEKQGLPIFGPSQKAAILEGSKVFTKKFMQDYNIPTAGFTVFRKRERAIEYVERIGAPVVIKADGLAAGKGVMVAQTVQEAIDAINVIMKDKVFGEAGNRVVVEDFMTGEEASFLAFTDGKTILPLPTSQDHKPIFDDDKGPNTGGMGAYSPAPVVTPVLHKQIMNKIMVPTVKGMAKEGRPYKGVLYAGLMINNGKAKVVEFNCRFGDPEAQPLLMRLKTDLVDIIEAVLDEQLHNIRLDIDPRPTVCVVMSSGGYPGSYEKNKVISGLDKAAKQKSVVVFHAGTALKNNKIVTAGGDIGAKAARHMKKTTKDEAGQAQVGIVMGSDSDLPVMQVAADFLHSMGIPFEISVNSAHRTPDAASAYAQNAASRGLRVIIAGAGMAAHLAGVLAAHTSIPVIGVPLDASSLNGLDALLSTVQMPPGVPVATMGIGKAGAKNAAVLAARILALHDRKLGTKLSAFKMEMAKQVQDKNRKLQRR